MFRTGELVTTLSEKLGIVLEIKHEKFNQYCKILWTDKKTPEWVFSGNLHELDESKQKK
jgi:hypothetical protein